MPRAKSTTAKPRAPLAGPATEAVAPPVPPVAAEPEILQRLDAPSKWSWAWVAGGVVLAAGLSVFAVRGAMKRGDKA